ncbi:SubName: Full=Uncharacterized protein {ECO:0000313/EMBL:CCA74380.1} [Serendipita indica DSM 11827]|nr:SubName: Full=Uncharacterized protein {ECO:0000313/EMBL:CCA74380.1} [Serendipita indica DSM 11827]
MSDKPSAYPPSSDTPVVAHVVDFAAVGLPEYSQRYALVLDGLFSPAECAWLLQQAVLSTSTENPWQIAQLNAGVGTQYTNTDVRNSLRIILDSPDLADWVLNKLRPHLGDIEAIRGAPMHKLMAHGDWVAKRKALGEVETVRENPEEVPLGRPSRKVKAKIAEPDAHLTRLNERLRFLKYTPGQFFKPHYDGCYYTPDRKEMSYMTLQIYLNGPMPEGVDSAMDGWDFVDPECSVHESEPLKGGATRIFSEDSMRNSTTKKDKYYDVEPRMGRVLVFEQEDLIHSGEEIVSGVKYTMRTDFMYSL